MCHCWCQWTVLCITGVNGSNFGQSVPHINVRSSALGGRIKSCKGPHKAPGPQFAYHWDRHNCSFVLKWEVAEIYGWSNNSSNFKNQRKRPISLLNNDYNILANILAGRLNAVILSIIHNDQTGFMPGKSTLINIRRTQLINQLRVFVSESRVLTSLDSARAFNSVEWLFLQTSLKKFGSVFGKWIGILYSSSLLVNGLLSSPIRLYRGTRQGCPLSTHLFAIVIKVLALKFRQIGVLLWGKRQRARSTYI